MNNLYIRFADDEARREFLLELMELKIYDPDKDITVWNLRHMFQTKRVIPKPGELDRWFHPLEFGKMSSPYLNLQPLSGSDAATMYTLLSPVYGLDKINKGVKTKSPTD